MNKKSVLSYIRRSLVMLPAVPVIGLGVTLCLLGGLGNDPLTSFEQGVSIQTGLSVGTASMTINGTILCLFLLLDRKMIGSGSFAMSFGVGYFMDFWNNIVAPMLPAQPDLWLRVVLMLVGICIIAVGISWYIPLNVGLQSLDMSALFIARLVKNTYGIGLSIFNAVVFIAAFFMGADWGVGTLLNIVCTGKIIDWLMPVTGRVSSALGGIPFVDVNKK